MERLEVKIHPILRRPYAEIPHEAMWNLVEYLSSRRTQVEFSYQVAHFTMLFIHLDQEGAQQFLDDWMASFQGESTSERFGRPVSSRN